MKMLLQLSICAFAALAASCDGNGENPPTPAGHLKLGSREELVGNAAGSFDIFVTSNRDWTLESQNDWLKPVETEGSGNMTVTIEYDASTETKRIGTIRFTAPDVEPVELLVTQTDATFSNPLVEVPDPWITRHEDAQGKVWYYFCRSGGTSIRLSKSDRLSVINGTKVVWNLPTGYEWNVAHLWAPELHHIDGAWYIYYAAGRPNTESDGSYRKQRTGVLRNTNADPTVGTWQDMGMIYTGNDYTPGIEATVYNAIYAIDMTVFKLNGQLYAVWSGNASETSGDQHLFIATMDNPYTISSSRVEISRPDKSWELYSGKVNEGPAILHNEKAGKLFIVYSCNGSWTSNYRLGMLTLDTSKDPMVKANWTKSTGQVFYRFDNTPDGTIGVNGVGHNCFTKSPDGTEEWIVYHVNHSRTSGWDKRRTFMQPFTWNADGTPDFGNPVGWGELLPLPSGETPAE